MAQISTQRFESGAVVATVVATVVAAVAALDVCANDNLCCSLYAIIVAVAVAVEVVIIPLRVLSTTVFLMALSKAYIEIEYYRLPSLLGVSAIFCQHQRRSVARLLFPFEVFNSCCNCCLFLSHVGTPEINHEALGTDNFR